jgi:hypothetical protein
VVSPAVPARDDRADQLAIVLREDQGTAVAVKQRGHGLASIGGTAVILGGLLPHDQQLINVSGRSGPQGKAHTAILPGTPQ